MADEREGEGAGAAAEPAHGLVLVADNDSGVNDLLREVLSRFGLRNAAVGDGASALEFLQRGGVSLLVCDLDMPEMSGRELLDRLAEVPEAPPVLVVSGYLDARSERDLAARPGVRGVFRKPFDVFAFAARAAGVVAESRPGGAAAGASAPDP